MGLRKLVDWLRLADYSAAKEKATDDVVARYSRGNVAAQNGEYIDREKLDALSEEGDKAMTALDKIMRGRTGHGRTG